MASVCVNGHLNVPRIKCVILTAFKYLDEYIIGLWWVCPVLVSDPMEALERTTGKMVGSVSTADNLGSLSDFVQFVNETVGKHFKCCICLRYALTLQSTISDSRKHSASECKHLRLLYHAALRALM